MQNARIPKLRRQEFHGRETAAAHLGGQKKMENRDTYTQEAYDMDNYDESWSREDEIALAKAEMYRDVEAEMRGLYYLKVIRQTQNRFRTWDDFAEAYFNSGPFALEGEGAASYLPGWRMYIASARVTDEGVEISLSSGEIEDEEGLIPFDEARRLFCGALSRNDEEVWVGELFVPRWVAALVCHKLHESGKVRIG